MSAAIRRVWTGCESSPASLPTRSTSALAGDVVVVWEDVSAVSVTENEVVVLFICTSGAPHARSFCVRLCVHGRCELSVDFLA